VKRILAILILAALVVAGLVYMTTRGPARGKGYFVPPEGATVTFFPAQKAGSAAPIIVSGSIDAGFMRPFLLAFQQHYPMLPVAYIQSRSGAFLPRALEACRGGELAADLYLTTSTDHLVRLANEDCAQTLPSSVGRAAPAQAAWRDQVVAFTVEPAAFVFARRDFRPPGPLPSNHMALLEWLRRLDGQHDRVGTYDIEASADGYDFAASDSRQTAIYGRLLESLSRTDIRLYCCSNVMVDAVDRGEVLFAYNVQLSYAYASQRAGSRIVVVVPDDYQALQTLSLMVPRGARAPNEAVRLATFLVSDEARDIARKDLSPPGASAAVAAAYADQLLAQATVSPVLLSLQDRSRRQHLIGEWRAAVHPASARTRPAHPAQGAPTR